MNVHSNASNATEPEWNFPTLPHVDVIGEEPASAVAYLFDIDRLKDVAGIYSDPVFEAILSGLRDLSQSNDEKLREHSFTIFAGDARVDGVFVLAIAINNSDIINFLSPYLRDAPGYFSLEAGSSRDFLPTFRYDKGYVIRYVDHGLEGSHEIDTEDSHGSGLKIYHRAYITPQQAGLGQTRYGRLIESK